MMTSSKSIGLESGLILFRENLSSTLNFLKRISESLKQDFSVLFSDYKWKYFGKLNKARVFIVPKSIVPK